MRCPFCSKDNDKVLESRIVNNGDSVRRRRQCLSCKRRFTSSERIEEKLPWVVKRDGQREKYSRGKLLSGVLRACHKLPIPMDKIEKMIKEVEEALQHQESREVKSSQIGDITLKKLQNLNQIAYVRFASVYKKFKDASEFIKVVKEVAK
ncbi:transcriptional repressor NrdR [Candidatus Saganbacteria bacterium]|nr:transcriptional repressor NrdR [Candidatus Saganbacteria bacterium]